MSGGPIDDFDHINRRARDIDRSLEETRLRMRPYTVGSGILSAKKFGTCHALIRIAESCGLRDDLREAYGQYGDWALSSAVSILQSGAYPTSFEEEMEGNYEKIGMKLFVPALSLGVMALIFALFTQISSLVGLTFGVVVGGILLMIFSRKNTPRVFLDDTRRMLDTVGPLSMLPVLLAALGAIFTAAGVGDVISGLVSGVIPQGNAVVGVIVYAIGMAVFTMVMGNAYGAITVMTVGIGAPFVLSLGADPALIGSVALTCGFCGTLMTPMAANFNIVPVAILEMKDSYGVIKKQVPIALFMLAAQIVYMIVFGL